MPYKSESQRKFFNSPAGKEKLGEEEVENPFLACLKM